MVDGLIRINDTFSAGDRLLQTVAQLLKKAEGGEQLARLGGDEFVILLPRACQDEIAKIVTEIKREQDHDTKDR